MKYREFRKNEAVVIDYETSGLSVYAGDKIFAAVLTFPSDGHSEVYQRKNVAEWKRVGELWGRSDVPKIAHNLKFEMAMTKLDLGLDIPKETELHCTMTMHEMLNNLSPKHGLDYAANRYAGYVKEWDEADKSVNAAFKIYGSYDKIPWSQMLPYITVDGERTALLYETMWPSIKANDKLLAEYNNEIELITTTQRMEKRGIMIDKRKARDLIAWMKKEVEANDDSILKHAGAHINLKSTKQLAKLLFTDLKLPILARTKTGLPSTDGDTIQKLRNINDHPILDCILKERSYKRGITDIHSYLDAAIDLIIHPNINTNRAATGRESSENPNLQNIQKEHNARLRFPVPARRCFRARPGYVLLLGDYAGIEMRFGVQGTQSPRLYSLLENDFDFHDACAKSFYGDRYINCQDATQKKMMRNRAKNGRFAMFYGCGYDTLAITLGLSLYETKIGFDRDRKEFPEFYTFMAECTRLARETGGIETFFGRFLEVPHDRPYAATDYKIQGSAAAFFKRAQNRVMNFIIKSPSLSGKLFMLMPVHDELVSEMHRSLLPYRDEIISEFNYIMTNGYPEIEVPVKVEWKLSTYTWDKAEEIKL
jgi:DNA polymerase I